MVVGTLFGNGIKTFLFLHTQIFFVKIGVSIFKFNSTNTFINLNWILFTF